mgnify:CR=1 FL=1
MGDLLEQSSGWLEDKRHQHLTVAVTYRRGGMSVDLLATIGRTVFEVDSGRGILEKVEARDFLVRAGDLVLGGASVLPERGDRVRETRGETVFVYEVMAPGREPHFRWSDPYRKTLRIHTKQVGMEAAP